MTWSLYRRDGMFLPPIIWKGGSQEKCVNEITEEFEVPKIVKINDKDTEIQKKLQFLSKCGSGKSSSLLNVIKEIGKGIIIVPSLKLQEQYFNDYGGNGKLYITKKDGTKLKIGTMFGRKNFTCRYLDDAVKKGETVIGDLIIYDKLKISCANRGLPCNRTLTKGESRIHTGCGMCKYFVPPPRLESDFKKWKDEEKLDGIKKVVGRAGGSWENEEINCEVKYYDGIDGKKYGLFVRKDISSVCEYYRQFYNYLDDVCDVIIFNKWKWEVESNFGRKPLVKVEAIDEFDEFLHGLNESIDISNYMIERLWKSKKESEGESINNKEDGKIYNELYIASLTSDRSNLVIDFKNIYQRISEEESKSKEGVKEDFGLLSKISQFMDKVNQLKYENKIEVSDSEEELSEMMYKLDTLNKFGDKAVMSTAESVRSISVKYNIPYPDLILQDLMSRSCNKVIFCSATTDSDFTNGTLYGLKFDKIVTGRQDQPGELTIMKPKYAMVNVSYTLWQDEEFVEYYNNLLKYIVLNLNAKGSTLVLTPAKKYIKVLAEYLRNNNAKLVMDFSGEESFYPLNNDGSNECKGNQITISQRMKRGIDLRDDLCRVVVWTKYPLADINDGYIKSLFNRFGKDTWRLLNDMAEQDVIQGVCRGLRHDGDWALFATPDEKVYNIVTKWWNEQKVNKLKG